MTYIREENQGQYNDKRVSERTPIIELNPVSPLSSLRDEQQVSGSGAIVDNESDYELQHNASNDFSKLLSSERGRYIPGNASEVGVGARTEGSFSDGDIEALWGYFHMEVDGNNNKQETIEDGLLFGKDSLGLFIQLIKGGTSKRKVYQSNWNLNSSENIDPDNGYVFHILYNYYGNGLIIFQWVKSEEGMDKQTVVDLHSIKIDGETSMGNSNLKVGGLIRSSNSSDTPRLFITGRQFSTIGKYFPNTRITTQEVEQITVGTSDYIPLVSFRRKQGNREIPIEFYGFDVLTDQDIVLEERINSDLTGANFSDIQSQESSETSIQYDSSASDINRSTGIKVGQHLAVGGQMGNRRSASSQQDLPLSFPDDSTLTIAAKAISSSAVVTIIGKIKEEY